LRAQWDSLPNPEAQVSTCVQYGNRLYAGLEVGGFYYSDDYGSHWSGLEKGDIHASITKIEESGPYIFVTCSGTNGDVLYRSKKDTLYFIDYNILPNVGPVSKVFSTDTMWYVDPIKANIRREIMGSNYTNEPQFTQPQNTIFDLIQSGYNLVAACQGKIYYSEDRGLSWQASPDSVNLGNTAKLYTIHQSLYCFNRLGSGYRSDNNGKNWVKLDYFVQNFTQFYLDQLSFDGDALLALSQYNSSNVYAWRSTDKGQSWVPVYPELPRLIATFNTPTGKLAQCKTGFLHSTDNGNTWRTRVNGLKPIPMEVFCINTNGDWITAPAVGNTGLYISEQHTDYQLVPITFSNVRNLVVQGDKIAINASPDLLYSGDGGHQWIRRPFPNNPISATTLFWHNDRLFCRYYDGYLHEYDPLLDTWKNIATPFSFVTNCAAALHNYLFSAGSWGVKTSVNGGLNWKDPANGLPSGYIPNQMFTAGERVFITGQNTGGLYSSSDFGLTWEYAGNGIPSNNSGFIKDITGAGDLLFTRVNEGGPLYISDNGGTQWYTTSLASGNAFGYLGVMTVIGDSLYLYDGLNQKNPLVRRPIQDFAIQKLFGTVYLDKNQNGVQDSTETGIEGINVYLTQDQKVTRTDSLGRYTLSIDVASDTLRILAPFYKASVTPAFYALDSAAQHLDFGVFADQQDAGIYLSSSVQPRPGFLQYFIVSLRNNSVEPLKNVQLNASFQPQWQLQSTLPMGSLHGDTLQWLLDSLPVFGQWDAYVELRLKANTPIGTQLSDRVWLGYASDADSLNNQDTLRQTVIGSFDPNDKSVDMEQITTKNAQSRPSLTYKIRFQNTGNAAAEFVRVRDTLPENVDPATFRLLSASHPVQVKLSSPGNLDFFFNEINLKPKSPNEWQSHGFIDFSVQLKAGLQNGDSIKNKAAIYFDYNAPVITNTALTRILDTLVVGSKIPFADHMSLSIFPNPAQDQVQITWPISLNIKNLEVFNAQGQLVQHLIPGTQHQLDFSVKNLPNGSYWVLAKQGNQVYSLKLSVLHP
jgi:photosystem II stability/assembly factor-like uncharacterized protein